MAVKGLNRIIQQIFEGNMSIDNLPVELSQFTYDEIMSFVSDGFGKLEGEWKINRMAHYERNITSFSGAKTFQEAKDMSLFVFDGEGNKRKFKEFKEYALKVDNDYNKVWLKTEQDTAFGTAQGADQWRDLQEDKEIFPLMQYQTADDERVRHDHAAWDNIIRPVDDSFWDTHMPPNGWNCRCSVIKLTEGKQTSLKGVQKNDDEVFSNNPGKDKFIFDPKKHPYFKHTKSENKAFQTAITWQ